MSIKNHLTYQEIAERNKKIIIAYAGFRVIELAKKFHLTHQGISRIIRIAEKNGACDYQELKTRRRQEGRRKAGVVMAARKLPDFFVPCFACGKPKKIPKRFSTTTTRKFCTKACYIKWWSQKNRKDKNRNSDLYLKTYKDISSEGLSSHQFA